MPLFDSVSYAPSPAPPQMPSGDPLGDLFDQINANRAYRGQAPYPSLTDAVQNARPSAQDQLRANLMNTPGAGRYPGGATLANLGPNPVPDLPDAPWQAGILPMSDDMQGQTHFDPQAGILGSLLRSAALPGDVATGKVDPSSPEGLSRAMEFAGTLGAINAPVPKPAGSLGVAGGGGGWGQASRDYLGRALEEHNLQSADAYEAGDRALQQHHDDVAGALFEAKKVGPALAAEIEAPDAFAAHLQRANEMQAPPVPPSLAGVPGLPTPAGWNDRALNFLRDVGQDHRDESFAPRETDAYRARHASIADSIRDMKAAGLDYQAPTDAPGAVPYIFGRASEMQAPPMPESWSGQAQAYLQASKDAEREWAGIVQPPAAGDAARARAGVLGEMLRGGPGYRLPDDASPRLAEQFRVASDAHAGRVPVLPVADAELAPLFPLPSGLRRLGGGGRSSLIGSMPPRETYAAQSGLDHPALAAHAAQIGTTPEDFAQRMFGDGHQLAGVYGDANGMTMEAQLPNGSYVKRTFKPDGSVYHALFQVPEGAQGDGTSKAILQSQIPLYEQMGRTKVDVHANIDVGGYSWGRYGFVPDQRSWEGLRRTAAVKLDQVQDQIDPADFAHLKSLTQSSDPRSLWELADADTPILKDSSVPRAAVEDSSRVLPHDMNDEDFNFAQLLDKMRAQTEAGLHGQPVPGYVPLQRAAPPAPSLAPDHAADIAANPKKYHTLGKELFLGSNWRGSLDLRDPDVIQRFRNYVGRHQ